MCAPVAVAVHVLADPEVCPEENTDSLTVVAKGEEKRFGVLAMERKLSAPFVVQSRFFLGVERVVAQQVFHEGEIGSGKHRRRNQAVVGDRGRL